MVSTALSLALLMFPQDSEAVEAAVRSMIKSVVAKEYESARAHVKVSTPSFKRTAGVDLLEKAMSEPGFTYEVENLTVQGNGPVRIVKMNTRFGPAGSTPFPEEIFVEVEGGNVKFLPKLSKEKPGPTGWLIVVLDNDPDGTLSKTFLQAKHAAEKTRAISSAKMVATAFFIYAADYDDNFPGSNWQKVIDPYLKSKEHLSFTFEGKTYSFSMNPRLYKRNFSNITSPAETVMLFVGQSDKLDFMFNGQTIIGYADGHVKAVTKEQAKKLIWKP